eukprot:6657722-Pyramimonas_sp.AAC.1
MQRPLHRRPRESVKSCVARQPHFAACPEMQIVRPCQARDRADGRPARAAVGAFPVIHEPVQNRAHDDIPYPS